MPLHKPIRSLLCLLQGLRDVTTTIELRNEITVNGRIEHVDEQMNVTVSSATCRLLNGHEEVYEQMFIQGAQIRYVLIPDEINVMSTIIKQVKESGEGSSPKFSKQRLLPSRLKKYEEERRIVREHVMGKGRQKSIAAEQT